MFSREVPGGDLSLLHWPRIDPSLCHTRSANRQKNVVCRSLMLIAARVFHQTHGMAFDKPGQKFLDMGKDIRLSQIARPA